MSEKLAGPKSEFVRQVYYTGDSARYTAAALLDLTPQQPRLAEPMKQSLFPKPMNADATRPKVLNHRASRTAEQLYFLFQGAYRQEARLLGEAAKHYFRPLQRTAAQIRLAPSRMIGIESAGEVMGVVEVIEPTADQPWCLIESLCVSPQAQRKGMARRLLQAVITGYQKRRQPLRVKVAVANKPALALYSSLQFRTLARETAHGVELLVLERPVS